MRLDHLLSTEFFFRTPVWRPSCGPCVGNGSRFSRGRAGVEEIVGFAGSFRGSGEWYGYAFGFPDRHPRLGRVRFSGCPRRDGVGLRAVGRFRSGAWWFENWIVDASNAMIFVIVCFIAISPGSFFGVWFRDRSFCDHFLQCDDLSSGVESYYQVFSGRVPP